jgi:hypothetical protein
MIEVMETKLRVNLIFFELEFNITRVLNELRVLLKFNLFFCRASYAATGYVGGLYLIVNATVFFLISRLVLPQEAH